MTQTLCRKSDILGPWAPGTAPPPTAAGSEGQGDCRIAQNSRLEERLGWTCSVAREGPTKQVETTPCDNGPLHGDSAQFLSRRVWGHVSGKDPVPSLSPCFDAYLLHDLRQVTKRWTGGPRLLLTTAESVISTTRAAKASEASAPATQHPRGITGTDSLHPHNPHINRTGMMPISQRGRLRARGG